MAHKGFGESTVIPVNSATTSPERHRHVSDARQHDSHYPPPPPADLNRRTILQGAAWTIPAIAVATIAPAASASTNAVLAFNQASYSGTACSTITGAYVTVTVGGVPTAGRSVTTTLSNGYTFADGTTTNTQVSDTNGRVNLPTISIASVVSSGTLTATTSGSTAATASIVSTSQGATVGFTQDSGTSTGWPALPSGVTAKSINAGSPDNISRVWVYGSDNNVWRSRNWGTWTKVSTGTVDAFTAINNTTAGFWAAGSTVGFTDDSGTSTSWPALPSGVTAKSINAGSPDNISRVWVYGSDNNVWRSRNWGAWTKVSSGTVSAFTAVNNTTGGIWAAGSTVGYTDDSGSFTTWPALPAGVTAKSINAGSPDGTSRVWVYGSDNNVWRSTSGGAWTKVSTGTVTAFNAINGTAAAFWAAGSTVGFTTDAGSYTTWPALPSGVTAKYINAGSPDNVSRVWVYGSDNNVWRSTGGGAWTKVSTGTVNAFTAINSTTAGIWAASPVC